jgi:radical SAM protein with 4Fe4S-binding SPASM domain
MDENRYAVKRSILESPLWKNGRRPLDRIDLELTERCNNNCVHCCINLPADDRAAESRELSTAGWKSLLEQVASVGFLSVRFTGGEPLLREDFEEIYLAARRLGLKVILFTNATLITPRLVSLFSRVPPLEKIEVSVYGMHKKSYEAVSRVPGSFEAARRGIDLLLEHNVPFVVKGSLLVPTLPEVEEFEAWAATIPWMDEPPKYSMFMDLRSRRDSEERNRLIRKVRISPEAAINVLTRDRESYERGMGEFCMKFMYPTGDELLSCGAGHGGGCIDAYGRLQMCLMLRHPDTVYDLKRGSLKDALENSFPRIKAVRASTPQFLERCALCFIKGLCEQCPAKSWAESGDLETPVEYFCEVAHCQAADLGLLSPGERAWEVKDWKSRVTRIFGKNGGSDGK